MAVFAVNAFTRLQALQTLLQALQRLTELVLGISQGRVNARLYLLPSLSTGVHFTVVYLPVEVSKI